MNLPDSGLDSNSARLLMSKAIDGELTPEEAERLANYLEQSPKDADWMESSDLLSQSEPVILPDSKKEFALRGIENAIQPEPIGQKKDRKILSFPSWLSLAGIAAAVAIVTGISLKDSSSSSPAIAAAEPAVVEFVETDIPDASTVVYADEQSGWTVVWVESFETDGKHI